MVPITVKLDDDSVAELDRFIAQGAAGNRTDALRAALASWLRAQRESEIVAEYQRGYADHPVQDDPDLAPWGEHGSASLSAWSDVQGDDADGLISS